MEFILKNGYKYLVDSEELLITFVTVIFKSMNEYWCNQTDYLFSRALSLSLSVFVSLRPRSSDTSYKFTQFIICRPKQIIDIPVLPYRNNSYQYSLLKSVANFHYHYHWFATFLDQLGYISLTMK